MEGARRGGARFLVDQKEERENWTEISWLTGRGEVRRVLEVTVPGGALGGGQ